MWKGKPVRAAGYLLQCGDQYLMIKEKGKWSDLGGKCESSDRTPIETARREAAEESNDTFPDVSNLPYKEYYSHKSKYLLFVVQVPETFEVASPLAWVKHPRRHQLHARLRYHPRRMAFMKPRSAIPKWL